MLGLNRWNENNRELFEVSRLQREIDRMFDDFLTPARTLETNEKSSYSPACDVEETDSQYLVSFDMPGVSKDNINIEIVDNILTVSGERKSEKVENKKSQHLVERSYGHFRRSFTLPSTIDADRVEANYHDGVLIIGIPKAESSKARQIKIGEEKPSFFRRITGSNDQPSPKDKGTTKAA